MRSNKNEYGELSTLLNTQKRIKNNCTCFNFDNFCSEHHGVFYSEQNCSSHDKDSNNIQYDVTGDYNKIAAPIFCCYGEE